MSVSPRAIIFLAVFAIIPGGIFITMKNEPVSTIAVLNVLIITAALYLLTGPAQTTDSQPPA